MPAAKVMIGRYYRPTKFETRASDGTYAALRPEMSSNASALQGALLRRPVQGRGFPIFGLLRNAIGSLI